ncbi:DNA-binding XRE family transcriptional regulator [Alkalibacillus flavidus]|uniref:DNA-binding XRE family transcriptional regulator n=1 Tax=Alkalibacillus flavidus TaxID=546021 RepID=A0ABV2KVS0_9BACI
MTPKEMRLLRFVENMNQTQFAQKLDVKRGKIAFIEAEYEEMPRHIVEKIEQSFDREKLAKIKAFIESI